MRGVGVRKILKTNPNHAFFSDKPPYPKKK